MKVTFRDTSATQYDENADVIDLKTHTKVPTAYGKLYLGDRYAAAFLQLKFRKCTHVINCDKAIHSLSRENDITYLNIDPADESSSDLEKAYNSIEENLKLGKTITVLCQTGNGKSAAVMVYYIMRKLSISPFESTDILKEKRSKIRISPSLMTIINREAKKLGLMKVAPVIGKKAQSYQGYYVLAIAVVFFCCLYFVLDSLTSKKKSKR